MSYYQARLASGKVIMVDAPSEQEAKVRARQEAVAFNPLEEVVDVAFMQIVNEG